MDPNTARERDHLRRLMRDIRIESGLRQAELAERLNRPQSFVSKFENGERQLDFVEMRAICVALGVPLTSVIRRFELAIRRQVAERPPRYATRAGKAAKRTKSGVKRRNTKTKGH